MDDRPLACPRCAVPLAAFEHGALRTSMCPTCRGLYFKAADLLAAESALLDTVFSSQAVEDTDLVCPSDAAPMKAYTVGSNGASVVVDGCPTCDALWFDRGELATLRKWVRKARRPSASGPASGTGPDAPAPVAPSAAEQQAQEILDAADRRLNVNSDAAVARTSAGWAAFALLSELPVEGYNPVYRTPVVTYALMALCVGTFIAQLAVGLEPLLLVPDEMWARPHTLFTSVFLHANVFHLAVNLYFLKICGDNVEDRLGRGWMLLLFGVTGLVGSLIHGVLTPFGDIPTLGASGAVSGILAAYVWFFPDVRLSLLPVWMLLSKGTSWIHLRAMFYVPIWFAFQMLLIFVGIDGIAVWAHVGGFLSGLGLIWAVGQHTPDARIATLAGRIQRGESVAGA